jgi:hypothetical protein
MNIFGVAQAVVISSGFYDVCLAKTSSNAEHGLFAVLTIY